LEWGKYEPANTVARGRQTTYLAEVAGRHGARAINGVAAVPIMVMIMLMASRRQVMGQFTLTPWLKCLGWLATGAMAAAAIGMFATW
jgi:hypothetical protein